MSEPHAPDPIRPPFHHVPVLGDLVVELFRPVPPGVVIDATLGGGGHARLLLDSRPDLRVVGLDQDTEALTAARATLAPYGDRVTFVHTRFDRLDEVMTDLHLHPVSGVLFDLGVSSPQLDRPERGFSYRAEGPLDMRMDTTVAPGERAWTASDVVNGYPEHELARVLREHGDERFADRIAKAIVAARPIESTSDLAAIVRDAVPAPARRTGGHPAKRTFQAIRIEVNRELAILPEAIDAAVDATAPGGRVVALAYHSGEDRIVKERFRLAATGGCTCPPGLPCVCDAVQTVRLLKRGAWKAGAEEVGANPRAESVRLRAVEKLPVEVHPVDKLAANG